jgi:serine protease AprX
MTLDTAGFPSVGPLLRQAMAGLREHGATTGMARMTLDMAAEGAEDPVLPVALALPPVAPLEGERWAHYKDRVLTRLADVQAWLGANAGIDAVPLIAANALQTYATPQQVEEVLRLEALRVVELDPLYQVTLLDDVPRDIELPTFHSRHPGNDGGGVRVAVLDSGIDAQHPWLTVTDRVSTCGESVDIPGRHGTHVAGIIASRDTVYGGVAPGVTLIDVKVLTALGTGQPSFITRGIDEALDREVDVISMSLGFNHLPTWSSGGHGWSCPDGRCQLCVAVNNAVRLEGVVVVAAAGNEHERARFLRESGFGASFDTEIACPGQAPGAITVGALTKQTFLTAGFSSRGPTAFNTTKPDIAASGVNITSSVPARRDPAGNAVPNLTRAELSTSLSGTSMATPVVSAAVALIIARRRQVGEPVTVDAVREELLGRGFLHLPSPANDVGVGRLSLGAL